jgi:hypothetical protein
MPSSFLQNFSSFEKLFKMSSNFKRLRIFGCKCFVLSHKNDKLSLKAIECVFMGDGDKQKMLSLL